MGRPRLARLPVVRMDGVAYELLKVRIEELEAWRLQRGLVAVGRATLCGDGSDWPPIVIYKEVEGDSAG